MSVLFQKAAMEQNIHATTHNGMATLRTSTDHCVDLFFMIGASRKKDITAQFEQAYKQEPELALRILQWARDIRGGSGERDTFRSIMKYMVSKHPQHARAILAKIPEIGRWDDVLEVTFGTPFQFEGFDMIRTALETGGTLCAKWMPRQGIQAVHLRKYLGLSPKAWRQLLVSQTKVVEQQMCAGQWTEIEYSKVPSQASSRYQKAFGKHDPAGYSKYLASLQKGETKINAGAVYPYDIVRSCVHGNAAVSDQQWKALPNYMSDSNERILPVCDVSGSMTCATSAGSSISCLDACVSLGLYISERNTGVFKDCVVTFSAKPTFVQLKRKQLSQRIQELQGIDWGGNTDLTATFNLLLATAVNNNLPQAEMPTMILVMSDMEFDSAGRLTAMEMIEDKYTKAGYKVPKLVWWNMNARPGNNPVRAGKEGAALVSGFSPAIMKSLLSNIEQFTPRNVMLKTVMVDRYAF